MKEFNFIEFNKNLQENLLDANSLISKIEQDEWYSMNTTKDPQVYYEEEELDKERLGEIINSILLKIKFAYEYLNCPGMILLLDEELKKYKGKFGKLEFIPLIDVFYSPPKFILENHLKAITCHVDTEANERYENINSKILLERVLRGTPKMLTDRKIQPRNEAEVKNEVYNNLIHVFPDTVREIPIAKVSKTYKPDIGIKKLKSAIEYKFVDSQTEAKLAIGGIFEDIQGYEGSADWTTFYAVIYMTDNFMTEAQVVAEFELSNAPHHWKPIVVFGKGRRSKRRVPKNGA